MSNYIEQVSVVHSKITYKNTKNLIVVNNEMGIFLDLVESIAQLC